MFSFFYVVNGLESPIDTCNIFEAQRQARTLGAHQLFVRNPGNNTVSKLEF